MVRQDVKDPKPFLYTGVALAVFGFTSAIPTVDNFFVDFASMGTNSLQLVFLGLLLVGFHFLYTPAIRVIRNKTARKRAAKVRS